MHRALARRELSRLSFWTSNDGPIPAQAGAIGVEYRGALGHPSSYGLLVGRVADGLEGMFNLDPMPGTFDVPSEHVSLGLIESEYRGALGAAITLLGGGVVITGIAEGRYGSSSTVFARTAAVLCVLLNSSEPLEAIEEVRIWTTWDEPWRACLRG